MIMLMIIIMIIKIIMITIIMIILIAELPRARSGAPWVRKFGKLSIRENLVMT